MSERKGLLGCIVAILVSSREATRRSVMDTTYNSAIVRAHSIENTPFPSFQAFPRRPAGSLVPSSPLSLPRPTCAIVFDDGRRVHPRAQPLESVQIGGSAPADLRRSLARRASRRDAGAGRRVGRGQVYACCIYWAVWTGLPTVRYTTEEQRFQGSRTRNRRIFAIGKLGLFGRFTTCCRSLRRWRM